MIEIAHSHVVVFFKFVTQLQFVTTHKIKFLFCSLVPVIPERRCSSAGFGSHYGKRRNLCLLGPFADMWGRFFSLQCCIVSVTVCPCVLFLLLSVLIVDMK